MAAPLYPLGHKLESAPALTAPQTLNLAAELGIRLVLNDGNLRAIGGNDAITKLALHIKANRSELVRLLAIEAANDGTVSAPGQHHADIPLAPETLDWHALDMAYQNHHFKCPICIAAGRGTRYGLRCGVGAALWADYEHASRNTLRVWQQPKGKK